MALTEAQKAARDGKMSASRVATLVNGDEAAILNLWREMVDDPGYVPVDLDDVWAVQLGSHTESLNLDWYERRTGRPVTRRGESVHATSHDWAMCTLDGYDVEIGPVECKHVHSFTKMPDIVSRTMPQLHWQMLCAGSNGGAISVIIGSNEPVIAYVARNDAYLADLIELASTFWRCVQTMTPPSALPVVKAPVVPTREVDMSGNNEWGSSAAAWLENRAAAKAFEAAAKTLKSVVPEDAKRAYGHNVEITRSKNGALTVREMK